MAGGNATIPGLPFIPFPSGTVQVASGGITAASLANNAITAAAVADNSIDAAAIAAGALTAAKFAAGAIDANAIAANALTAAKFAAGAIAAAAFAAGALDAVWSTTTRQLTSGSPGVIKSIQRGVTSIPADGVQNSVSATITTVDLAKSEFRHCGDRWGAKSTSAFATTGRMSAGNQVTFERAWADAAIISFHSFEVTEWN